jgi:hypothetical protein
MKKSDLKTGMLVENRYGRRYMVFIGGVLREDCIIGDDGFDLLSSYTDDLKSNADFENLDIMKIYEPKSPSSIRHYIYSNEIDRFKLIWNRKNCKKIEKIESEISEIEEILADKKRELAELKGEI